MRISDWSSDVCSSDLHAGPSLHSVLPYEMTPTRGVADAAFNGFTPPTPRVIAYASDGGSGFAGGVGGAADLQLPELRTQGSDGTGLVTANPCQPHGHPYYHSMGKRRRDTASCV